MKSGFVVVLSILALFFAAGGIGYIVSVYNSLVQVKNNIGKAWQNIDVLLLQRNEELPKLIDTTKAYVTHEKEVMEKVVKLRILCEKARKTPEKTRFANEFESAFSQLKMILERYPELKANEVFLKIQARVSALEGAIADRRVFFNETVKIYNVQREQFPQLIFAWLMGLRAHPYLDIPKDKRDKDASFAWDKTR